MDISEKFGASWLGKGSALRAPSISLPGINLTAPADAPVPAALIPAAAPRVPVDAEQAALAKQILSALGEAQDQTEQVYSLIDQTGFDISKLLSVVDWLEATGFVSVTHDKHGNHTLRLTEAGEAWIS